MRDRRDCPAMVAGRAGRLSRSDYTQARVVADSQEACSSYGLSRGSQRYERCVQRETVYRTPG